MTRNIDDEKLRAVQEDAEGTCKSLAVLIEHHELDMDEDELEDALLDGSLPIELCAGCGWWFEVCSLEHDEAAGGGLCDSCVPGEAGA